MFVITEKAPTRAFSWLKVPSRAFTFKTLLRHYFKWALSKYTNGTPSTVANIIRGGQN